MTMTLVETIEVPSGGASSIEFTSIPQDADDLLLVLSLRNDGNFEYSNLKINNVNTSGSFPARALIGTGSSVSSTTSRNNDIMAANPNNATSNTFGNTSVYIANYTSSSAKSISVDSVTENNGTLAYQSLHAISFTGSGAVTSVGMVPGGSAFLTGSSASLYKVTKFA